MLILVFVVFAFVLTKTPFGRHLILIGGNPIATYRAGIRVDRDVAITFILSGAIAGFAGWLLASRTAGATANLGIGMLFEAFAAVVIGGVSLKGGYGRLSGVFAGVLLLSSIQTAINVWGMPPHYTQMIRGAPGARRRAPRHAEDHDPAAVSMSGQARTDRVAIVIGAARGIGCGIARRFVEEGARVVIGDTEASGAAAAAGLGGAGRRALRALATFPRRRTREAIVEAALAAFGRLDILVQNAGIYPWTLIENTSADEWDRVLAVNLKGCFLAARAALKPMRQAGYGRIVFTSSITGPRVTQSRPRPLFGEQGRHQRLHPRRGDRVRRLRHHRQRRRAGQHPHRGHEAAPQPRSSSSRWRT